VTWVAPESAFMMMVVRTPNRLHSQALEHCILKIRVINTITTMYWRGGQAPISRLRRTRSWRGYLEPCLIAGEHGIVALSYYSDDGHFTLVVIGVFHIRQNPIGRPGISPNHWKRDPLSCTRGSYICRVAGLVSTSGHGCKSIIILETDSFDIDIIISNPIVDISTGYVPPHFRIFISLIQSRLAFTSLNLYSEINAVKSS